MVTGMVAAARTDRSLVRLEAVRFGESSACSIETVVIPDECPDAAFPGSRSAQFTINRVAINEKAATPNAGFTD